MATWDVFHADRLELERELSTEAIRAALARGDFRDDDLVRPAGSSVPWKQIADFPELLPEAPEPPPEPAAGPAVPSDLVPPASPPLADFEEVQPGIERIIPAQKNHEPTLSPDSASPSDVAFPVIEAETPPARPHHEPGRTAPPPPSAWTWDDDEDDEDEDNEGEGEDEGEELEEIADDLAALEESAEIEALSDGGALSSDEPEPPRPAVHSPGRARPGQAEREDAASSTGKPDRDDGGEYELDLRDEREGRLSHVALPVVRSRDRDEGKLADGAEIDEEDVFSLSRSATAKIEELDLAPMVDVAFNLVLFFMVTATTVLYKTLEIPKPSGESPAAAVAQGRSRSLDDLKNDYILVEIDEAGAMKLDGEPIAPVMEVLVEQLRRAREKTGRKDMLLSADYATHHRNAVLAYDAANEIGLGIAITKPRPPQGPAPRLRGAGASTPVPAPSRPGGAPFRLPA